MGRLLSLGLVVASTAAGCAAATRHANTTRSAPAATRATGIRSPGPSIAAVREPRPDVRRYLARWHRKLVATWDQLVRQRADSWLPADHPANARDLVTGIDIQLDPNGQINALRISHRSGYAPFDHSAIATVQSSVAIAPFPPPSLREDRIVLRWHFFRDERSCDPRYARVQSEPLALHVALRRALAREDFRRAAELLEIAGPRPELLALVAGVGLRAGTARRARSTALRIANGAQLVQALRDEDETLALEALARIRSPAALETALPAIPAPRVRTAARARLLQLTGSQANEARLRELLSGTDRERLLALDALARFPVGALDHRIGRLARQNASLSVRLAAIRAISAARRSAVPLYAALHSKHPELVLAAIHALGRYPGNRLSASYRLAALAYHGRGAVAKAAAATLIRIAHPRFVRDARLLARRLRIPGDATEPRVVRLPPRPHGLALLVERAAKLAEFPWPLSVQLPEEGPALAAPPLASSMP